MTRFKRLTIYILLCFTALLMFENLSVQETLAASSGKNIISKSNKAVVIRVSFSTSAYHESWGGTFQAVPIKNTDCYELYDIVIWPDRINLYKFDNNLEMNPQTGFPNAGMPGTSKKYYKWRESFCLKSVKCKNTRNTTKASSTLKKAYISFFSIVKKNTSSNIIILRYSGHGGAGLFNSLSIKDTKYVLKKGTKIWGRKFAIIDYGTSCQTSNTELLDIYAPYTQYMIASQFDAGGWKWDKWNYNTYKKVDYDSQYSNLFKKGQSIEQTAKKMAKQISKNWKYGKKDIKKNKLKQSVTVINMANYSKLMKNIRKDDNYITCEDLKRITQKCKNKRTRKQYQSAIVYYTDNSNLFKWDKKYYGVTVY